MIDTSVLIAGMPAQMVGRVTEYCSSTICRAELAQGLNAFARDPQRHTEEVHRRELLRLLDSLPAFWVDFGCGASDGYGTLTAEPRSALRLKDALIAGHALALELPLVTVDKGFSRFPGVRVLSPEEAG